MKLEKNPEGIRPFEYHCAHAYWAFHEVAAAIFGASGMEIGARVLKDFASEYGTEMADMIAGYKDTNFNVM